MRAARFPVEIKQRDLGFGIAEIEADVESLSDSPEESTVNPETECGVVVVPRRPTKINLVFSVDGRDSTADERTDVIFSPDLPNAEIKFRRASCEVDARHRFFGSAAKHVDGDLDVQTTGNVAPQNSATPLSLGRQNAPSFTCCYYDGVMDEVRIWSVARTQREIQKSMTKKVNTNRLPAGLVAYWRMDEGTGDVALDLTGNGHDMRLGNSVGSDAGDPTWVTPGMP